MTSASGIAQQLAVKASFVRDFELVCAHYECTLEEVEQMRFAARNDMENAERSFRLMADKIQPARNVNANIRKAIAAAAGPGA